MHFNSNNNNLLSGEAGNSTNGKEPKKVQRLKLGRAPISNLAVVNNQAGGEQLLGMGGPTFEIIGTKAAAMSAAMSTSKKSIETQVMPSNCILPNESIQKLGDFVHVGSNFPEETEVSIQSKIEEPVERRYDLRNSIDDFM